MGRSLVPIDLFFVQYEEGDPLGAVLAWYSMIPICVVVAVAGILTVRRDLHTVSLFFGLVFCESTSLFLKRLIRQPRPADSSAGGYGMPSSHSQFAMFFAAYVTAILLFRFKFRHAYTRPVLLFIIWGSAVIVCFSRYYLRYHDPLQVVAGATLGVLLGFAWYGIADPLIRFVYHRIKEHPFIHYLMVWDPANIPHVLEFEYQAARLATEASNTKSNKDKKTH